MNLKEKNDLIRIRESFADLIRRYDNGHIFDLFDARKLLIRIDDMINFTDKKQRMGK